MSVSRQSPTRKQQNYSSINNTSTSFGSSTRFPVDKEKASRPISYLAFKTFDHKAEGRAVSTCGSFPKAAHTSFFTKPTTPVSFYDTKGGVGQGVKNSHGVKRTAPRFVSEESDSVGPIYAPMRQDRVKATKFSTAQRFSQQKQDLKNGEPQPAPEYQPSSDLFPDLLSKSGGSSTTPPKGQSKNNKICTFGSRTDAKLYHDKSAESELHLTTFVEDVQKYKGKWGKATRSQKQIEVLPGPGHFLKNEFQSATAKWTFGRRTREARSTTPGPGAYNLAKFSKFGKPDAPTFARRSRDTLDFVAGKDSPGPAIYSKLR